MLQKNYWTIRINVFENVVCYFHNELYKNSQRDEEWIQCQECEL